MKLNELHLAVMISDKKEIFFCCLKHGAYIQKQYGAIEKAWTTAEEK